MTPKESTTTCELIRDLVREIERLEKENGALKEAKAWKCVKCGTEYSSICDECAEEEISIAFHQLSEERSKSAKRYRLVPIEEDDALRGEGGKG